MPVCMLSLNIARIGEPVQGLEDPREEGWRDVAPEGFPLLPGRDPADEGDV